MSTIPSHSRPWFVAGDLNGFFGLVVDNLSILGFIAMALIGIFGFPAEVVFGRMFPGTALGVLVGFSGWLGLLILACWVLVAAVWRYSSLSSLVAAVMAPMLYILLGGDLWEFNKWIFLATLAMSALLAYRHKLNIQRLLEGKESKLGQKKSK